MAVTDARLHFYSGKAPGDCLQIMRKRGWCTGKLPTLLFQEGSLRLFSNDQVKPMAEREALLLYLSWEDTPRIISNVTPTVDRAAPVLHYSGRAPLSGLQTMWGAERRASTLIKFLWNEYHSVASPTQQH